MATFVSLERHAASFVTGRDAPFDSMAVANVLNGIEERFDVLIEDDDVEAEDFMTYGRLLAFVERLAGRA